MKPVKCSNNVVIKLLFLIEHNRSQSIGPFEMSRENPFVALASSWRASAAIKQQHDAVAKRNLSTLGYSIDCNLSS